MEVPLIAKFQRNDKLAMVAQRGDYDDPMFRVRIKQLLSRKIGRRGYILVSKDEQGVHRWLAYGKPECSDKKGRELESRIDASVECGGKLRKILAYVEVPRSDLRMWRDVALPVFLSVVLALLALIFHRINLDPAFDYIPITNWFMGLLSPIAFGYAGWVFARSLPWARRITPVSGTVWKQSRSLIISISLVVAAVVASAFIVPDQWRFKDLYESIPILSQIVKIISGSFVWSLIGVLVMASALFRGIVDCIVTNIGNSQKEQQILNRNKSVKLLFSMLLWRVYLENEPCPSQSCQRHP
ncbi:hypothetical protein AAFM46_09600 [Arthrobacter sp. TMP15]|uniref:hypothetical protein n=1 Tax=Arthrobacter sp. TMP15 TaxID=3140789 RepID=UPI0031BB7748